MNVTCKANLDLVPTMVHIATVVCGVVGSSSAPPGCRRAQVNMMCLRHGVPRSVRHTLPIHTLEEFRVCVKMFMHTRLFPSTILPSPIGIAQWHLANLAPKTGCVVSNGTILPVASAADEAVLGECISNGPSLSTLLFAWFPCGSSVHHDPLQIHRSRGPSSLCSRLSLPFLQTTTNQVRELPHHCFINIRNPFVL